MRVKEFGHPSTPNYRAVLSSHGDVCCDTGHPTILSAALHGAAILVEEAVREWGGYARQPEAS